MPSTGDWCRIHQGFAGFVPIILIFLRYKLNKFPSDMKGNLQSLFPSPSDIPDTKGNSEPGALMHNHFVSAFIHPVRSVL